MKFVNSRFNERPKERRTDTANAQNRRIASQMLGYDPVSDIDRNKDIIVYDKEVRSRVFVLDNTLIYCGTLFDPDEDVSEEYRR